MELPGRVTHTESSAGEASVKMGVFNETGRDSVSWDGLSELVIDALISLITS